MSNNSLKLLLPNLQRRFGVIREKGGLHDHPNALEFKYRLRSYIMGRNEGAYSEFSNVEVDDTPDLPITGQIIQKVNSKNDPLVSSTNEELLTTEGPELEELHELTYDGLENLAGFICYKLREPGTESTKDNATFTWIDHLSEGGLHKPSDTFVQKMQQLEHIFRSVNNGDSILVTKNYLAKLMSKSVNVDCSEAAKKLFFISRMYFRIKELNKSLNKVTLGRRKVKIVT